MKSKIFKRVLSLFMSVLLVTPVFVHLASNLAVKAESEKVEYVPVAEGKKLEDCFPDPAFAWYVYKNILKRLDEGVFYRDYVLCHLDVALIENTRRIDVYGNSCIRDLTGIQSLKNLAYLDCGKTSINSLDVSGLQSLHELKCSESSLLASINVRGCSMLRYMFCGKTAIESLDVSGLKNLYELKCNKNVCLSSINVEGCNQLRYLFCGQTGLKSLDVSSLNFHKIDCTGDMELTSLNVDGSFKNISLPKNQYYKFQIRRGAPSPQNSTCVDSDVEK